VNIHDLINYRAAIACFMTDDCKIEITTPSHTLYIAMLWDQPEATMWGWDGAASRVTVMPRAEVRGFLLRVPYEESVMRIKITDILRRDVRIVYPYDRRYFYV